MIINLWLAFWLRQNYIHHDDHDVFAASPLFAKSDMIVKRMKRTKRIGTDFDSPSALPYPPQAE
jgi:hypothetical protein